MEVLFWASFIALSVLWIIVKKWSIDEEYAPIEVAEAFQQLGTPIKLWLDDERPAPRGYIHVLTPSEACEILSQYAVEAISLDHDLGLTEDGKEVDGNAVVQFLERRAAMGFSVPAEIAVHSANIAARPRMEAGIEQIRKFQSGSVRNWHIDRHPAE